MGLGPVTGHISTVVSSPSTFGTVICLGVRLEITLIGCLVNLVGHLQGQGASGQNLDASSVKTPPQTFFGQVIWLYDSGSSEPLFHRRQYRAFQPLC